MTQCTTLKDGAQCQGEAVAKPTIRVWPDSQRMMGNLTLQVDLPTCRDCMRESELEPLLEAAGFDQMCEAINRAGGMLPLRETAQLVWAELD